MLAYIRSACSRAHILHICALFTEGGRIEALGCVTYASCRSCYCLSVFGLVSVHTSNPEPEGALMHGTKANCCLLDNPASPVSHDAVLGAARLQRQNAVANWP